MKTVYILSISFFLCLLSPSFCATIFANIGAATLTDNGDATTNGGIQLTTGTKSSSRGSVVTTNEFRVVNGFDTSFTMLIESQPDVGNDTYPGPNRGVTFFIGDHASTFLGDTANSYGYLDNANGAPEASVGVVFDTFETPNPLVRLYVDGVAQTTATWPISNYEDVAIPVSISYDPYPTPELTVTATSFSNTFVLDTSLFAMKLTSTFEGRAGISASQGSQAGKRVKINSWSLDSTDPTCGDGIADTDLTTNAEECDDGQGNNANTDSACRTDCSNPTCGDGIIDTAQAYGEECDEPGGNSNDPNNCRPDCTNPVCGDGILDDNQEYGEVCDTGSSNSDTEPNACRTTCVVSYCGDNVVDSTDDCDPPQEGCTDECVVAAGYVCEDRAGGSICQDVNALCGDGNQDPFEECDNGVDNNDVEPGACKLDCSGLVPERSNTGLLVGVGIASAALVGAVAVGGGAYTVSKRMSMMPDNGNRKTKLIVPGRDELHPDLSSSTITDDSISDGSVSRWSFKSIGKMLGGGGGKKKPPPRSAAGKRVTQFKEKGGKGGKNVKGKGGPKTHKGGGTGKSSKAPVQVKDKKLRYTQIQQMAALKGDYKVSPGAGGNVVPAITIGATTGGHATIQPPGRTKGTKVPGRGRSKSETAAGRGNKKPQRTPRKNSAMTGRRPTH